MHSVATVSRKLVSSVASPSRFDRHHTVAILGPSDRTERNWWIVTDFAFLNVIVRGDPECSEWFVGPSIRLRETRKGFLIGDPAAQRIKLRSSPFETIIDENPEDTSGETQHSRLLNRFLSRARKMAQEATGGDTMTVVLAGHGREEDGAFLVGWEDNDGSAPTTFPKSVALIPSQLLKALEPLGKKRVQVFLISTACFSGRWVNPAWTLISASTATTHSLSIAQSGSGEFRGGVFTHTVMAYLADEANISIPQPGNQNEDYEREKPPPNHLQPLHMHISPSSASPRRTMWKIFEWFETYRKSFNRGYLTPFMISPLDINETAPGVIPFRPFTKSMKEKFTLEAPSPPN